MGPNIVVFNDVTIKPPYKIENITGNPDSRQVTYVKKIVERFMRDQANTNISTLQTSPPSQRHNSSASGTSTPVTNSSLSSSSATVSNVKAN